MYSLIEDLSTLTTISSAYLDKLVKKSNCIICDCIEDSTLKSQDETEVDIGIGILRVSVEDNNVKYQFVPGKDLDKGVKDTIISGKNPLTCLAEETLVQRIMHAYKDYT